MRNSFSISIIFLVFSIIGLALLPKISLQLKPNHKGQSVHVSYNWGNLSAEVVEKEVTAPLEGVLSAIKGIKDVTSESRKGEGKISLTFKKGVDIDAARFEVSSLMRSVYKKLPEGVTLPIVSYKKGTGDSDPLLMVYNINGEGSNYQLQKYAEENIANHIGQLSDVSKVNVSGATPMEWELSYNTNSMLAAGIVVDDLKKAIRSYLESKELGAVFNIRGENLFLSFIGQPTDLLQWGGIVVGKKEGRIIYLTDVVSIKKKEQAPKSYYRINGLSTIYLVVYSAQGANQIQLANQIKEQVGALKANFPDNFSMMLNYDASEEIEKEITSISTRALMAIGILLLFVLAISRRWRYLMIILVSLMVNLFIAIFFYYLLGIEIHLYSLAGITVSLGIIIDNTIVMVDHIRHNGNKKVFLAVLAATLTTIGSLTVIFFLKEQQRLNLVDFAWVMIINLTVSLFVALWFIPALMDKFPLTEQRTKSKERKTEVTGNREQAVEGISLGDVRRISPLGVRGESEDRGFFFKELEGKPGKNYKLKSRTYRWSMRYSRYVLFFKRWRWAFIIAIIWGFGLPAFMIPEEIKIDEEKSEEATWWTDLYNSTLGNQTYVSEVRPWLNKILGGSLYYFTFYMDEPGMNWDDQKTKLTVIVSMPDGATLEQMNKVFMDWENYLASFKEIDRFISRVDGINRSTIEITFKEGEGAGIFPYVLKEQLESKAIETGGADFYIYGVGRGFSNALYSERRNCSVELKGYNYDQLIIYAQQFRDSILLHPRINEVVVKTGSMWRGKPRYEFVMSLNPDLLAANNSSILNVYNNLRFYSPGDIYAGNYYDGEESSLIYIREEDKNASSIWHFKNNLLRAHGDYLRLNNVGSIIKKRAGSLIKKVNQQYSINVEYDFIGPGLLSKKVLEQNIEKLDKELPLGYSVTDGRLRYAWNHKEKTQYWLLLLVVGIIYFICAILLESLVQPLAVIATIPISFIGVFLTFAIFKLKFDQGGYASMILLCGITVNSALYIINDYNNNKRSKNSKPRLQHYIKAYNHKIIPIMLTILSTILGMIPFLMDGQQGGFWFSLACGSIGGLLFSILAIVVWLPLFMNLLVTQRKHRDIRSEIE
jgi:multidrug efflux pump subunit AcrB